MVRAPRTLAAVTLAMLSVAWPARADVWIAGEGERVLSRDPAPGDGSARQLGWAPGQPLQLRALRGEVVAFQIVISAEAEPIRSSSVQIDWTGDARGLDVEAFVEHYVEVTARSRHEEHPMESLAWTPEARPRDDRMLGWLPDALVPVSVVAEASPEAVVGLRYPIDVPSHESRAVWIDIQVGSDATPGERDGEIVVSTDGGRIASIPLEVTVQDAQLPYRPVSFLAYYGTYELESRFSAQWTNAERDLWQLLHAHHVDAVASEVTSTAALERLRGAHDGSWFTEALGYRGPGQGEGPEVVILGTYGELGDASPEKADLVAKLAREVPGSVQDVLLYAVDEQCESDRGPTWRRMLDARMPEASRGRVRVAHTCSSDPSGQDVDLVLMAAQGYTSGPARASTRRGKPVWVYNGQLPRAGPLMLDAPLTSLQQNAWIAAAYGVERWFLWETTFWNDDNRGGRGPVDVFLDPETFHNADGDACLYDGLLVFPGTQRGTIPPSKHHPKAGQRYEASSLGAARVFPSMRLKSLRRGIQDAGLLALARSKDPERADQILAEMIPRAFDDVALSEPTPWSNAGLASQRARAQLRDLIGRGAHLERSAVREVLEEAAGVHEARRGGAAKRPWIRWSIVAGLLGLLAVVLAWDRRR